MSTFGSDFYNLISNDASINALCSKIYYEKLPDVFNLTDKWIVYTFRRIEQQDVLNNEKDIFSTYTIYIQVQDKTTDTLETLCNSIIDRLNGAHSGHIDDIWFINDNHQIDLDNNTYVNTLEFGAYYVP
jgi:hypothetical protein